MNRRRPIALIGSLLIFCGAIDAVAQDAPGPPARPEVTVLDPGTGPREALRYKFEEGYTARMAMDMSMRMAVSMAGQQMPATAIPTVRMIMTVHTSEVAADGSARLEFESATAELLGDAGADPALAGQLNASLGQIGGISGWARIDSSGNTLDAGLDLPPGVDPGLSQITDNVESSMQQMSAPLPTEPVGTGARWRVATNMNSGGFDVVQSADYTLISRTGDNLEIGVSLTQSAPSQRIEIPGLQLPAGTEANLVSLESTGSGTMRINLSDFVPTSAISTTTAMALGIVMQGTSMQMAMNMETDISMAPVSD